MTKESNSNVNHVLDYYFKLFIKLYNIEKAMLEYMTCHVALFSLFTSYQKGKTGLYY